MSCLTNKKILLGVCGSIAAYKTLDWLRQLQRQGAQVEVILTAAATRFVTPLSFAALSRRPVHSDMFAAEDAHTIPHITLAQGCDGVLLAPATATTLARLAHGLADDLLAAVVLACRVPVVVCPAMNPAMYTHPATQANLERLRAYGYRVVTPETGEMACGDSGPGRLPQWPHVLFALEQALSVQDLAGKRFLVTAGPTREYLDPVRFLTNPSSGRMGYAVARAAAVRGAAVTLISGPVDLAPVPAVERVSVTTAAEMAAAVHQRAAAADVIVMTAAVGDFRFPETATQKIKKTTLGTSLTLEVNPDILAELGARKKAGAITALLVGFAAESQDHLEEGRRKLAAKNCDLLCVNDILAADRGFGAATNELTVLDRDGGVTTLSLAAKEEVAHRLVDHLAGRLG